MIVACSKSVPEMEGGFWREASQACNEMILERTNLLFCRIGSVVVQRDELEGYVLSGKETLKCSLEKGF